MKDIVRLRHLLVPVLAASCFSALPMMGCSSLSDPEISGGNEADASGDSGEATLDGNGTLADASNDARVDEDAGINEDAEAGPLSPEKVLYGSSKWGPHPDDPSDQSFAQADAQFGGSTAMPVARYYGQDVGPSLISDPTVFAAGRKFIMHSWKAAPAAVASGAYDAELVTLLRSYPAGVTVLVSYYHEPENFTSAADQSSYRAAWDHIIPIIRTTSGVSAKVGSILIVTAFTMSGGNPIASWWPQSQTPDYLGVDMDGNTHDSYSIPLGVWSAASTNAKAYSAAKGCGWAVAEFEHERTSTDTTGTGRAAFIHTMTTKFTADGARLITYFNSRVMSGAGALELGTPEMTMWQNDVQGSE